MTKPLTQPLSERFWPKVQKTDGCWEWQGQIGGRGYGQITVDGQSVGAHRVSWEMHNGKIPSGQLVCHTCDNRLCVRPDHLWLGTNRDNIRDMVAKGRHPGQRKTHCPQGHEYSPDNIYWMKGYRNCRTCCLAKDARRYERTKAARV